MIKYQECLQIQKVLKKQHLKNKKGYTPERPCYTGQEVALNKYAQSHKKI